MSAEGHNSALCEFQFPPRLNEPRRIATRQSNIAANYCRRVGSLVHVEFQKVGRIITRTTGLLCSRPHKACGSKIEAIHESLDETNWSAAFRQMLSRRGLIWAVGSPSIRRSIPMMSDRSFPSPVMAVFASIQSPTPCRLPPKHVGTCKLEEGSWRRGTKGRLTARRAALRIRIADGTPQRILDKGQQHMPGEEAWLVGEWRSNDERRYYLQSYAAMHAPEICPVRDSRRIGTPSVTGIRSFIAAPQFMPLRDDRIAAYACRPEDRRERSCALIGWPRHN